jgi:hypothetical protein
MSETINPETLDALSRASPEREAAAAPTGPAVAQRPALVTFAAIMLLLLGAFELTWAIVEFFRAPWIGATVYGTFGGYLFMWAIFDTLVAALAFYAGFDVLRGGTFGQVMGLVFAGLSAIRWFFYLPAAPWLGVVMLTIDVLVIYGLVAHSDYFGANATQ